LELDTFNTFERCLRSKYWNLPNNRVEPFNHVDFSKINKRVGLNKAV
jgi:hypothetical protein